MDHKKDNSIIFIIRIFILLKIGRIVLTQIK